jgi:hypothetical protein
MNDILVERHWPEPLTAAAFWKIAEAAGGCLGLHRVNWDSSLLSLDGHDLMCHFTAPDVESVRIALRQAGSVPARIWACTVHNAPGTVSADLAGVVAVVSREFEDPVSIEDIQAIEEAGQDCLDRHRVRFLRTYFAADRKRMLCLYSAPDAESVRIAQREAAMPVDRVRSVRRITIGDA